MNVRYRIYKEIPQGAFPWRFEALEPLPEGHEVDTGTTATWPEAIEAIKPENRPEAYRE